MPIVLIVLVLIGLGYYRHKNNGSLNGIFNLNFLKFGKNSNTNSTLSFNKTTVENTNPELSMSNPSFS